MSVQLTCGEDAAAHHDRRHGDTGLTAVWAARSLRSSAMPRARIACGKTHSAGDRRPLTSRSHVIPTALQRHARMAYRDSGFLLWWTHGGKRREFRDPRANLCGCAYSGPEHRARTMPVTVLRPISAAEQTPHHERRIDTAA